MSANWKRAWYYPEAPGEDMHAAVNRECVTVRNSLGIFDASTLGKIEVVGPDAGEVHGTALHQPWEKLEAGRCRYGIMLREDGFIYDDGVVGRLAPDRFHVTTTTGGAARVHEHDGGLSPDRVPAPERLADLDHRAMGGHRGAGPKAREDHRAAGRRHRHVRRGLAAYVGARGHRSAACRPGCSACRSPASAASRSTCRPIRPGGMGSAVGGGQKYGACAYGTETMHVLRAEKGYIIVGQDTDGTVTPYDAGLDWAVGKKKTDFVGIRGLKRPDLTSKGRKQLVGLLTEDPKAVLEEGAQIVVRPETADPDEDARPCHLGLPFGRGGDRADRLGEHRLARRAGGAGLGLTNKMPRAIRASANGGCQFVDIAENWRSSAPSSCSAASLPTSSRTPAARPTRRVFLALLQAGRHLHGHDLAAGGHLTHGSPRNHVGQVVQGRSYGVRPQDTCST
jgi:glycine cleavage system aminomethyltransferase T